MPRINCNGCGHFIGKQEFEDGHATHEFVGDGTFDDGILGTRHDHYLCGECNFDPNSVEYMSMENGY